MKIRLLYILYYPPTLQRDGKDLLIPSPFYMCPFTGPPPLLRGPSRGGGGRAHHTVPFFAGVGRGGRLV